MEGHVALVEVRHLRFGRGDHGMVGYEKGDRSALRVVILAGNMQNFRADHGGERDEHLRQPFGIILFVDIGDIIFLFTRGLGVTYVVNIETERFGKIVESV